MALGDYSKTTYINGAPPGISAPRLNNNEDKTAELDTQLESHVNNTAPHGATITSTASKLVIRDASGNIMAKQFVSDVAQGTSPIVVTSTTKVNNLNVDQLDGYEATAFVLASLLSAAGDIPYATGASAWARLEKGAAYQVLGMNSGATAPQYMASLQSLIAAAGDLIVGSAANTPTKLAMGTALQLLRVNSGATGLEWFTSTFAQAVAGTYTGNNNTDTTERTISIGVTPKIVLIFNQSGQTIHLGFYDYNTLGIRFTYSGTFTVSYNSYDRPSCTTNGFIIAGNLAEQLNRLGYTYKYVAIG